MRCLSFKSILEGRREILAPFSACLFVLGVFLFSYNTLYRSTSHERQCQTLEISKHIYNNGLFSFWQPRANFLNVLSPDYPSEQDYTICRFEFPFHGVLGWFYSKISGFNWVSYSVISLFFSFISILFAWLFFRLFVGFYAALFGLTLLTVSPLFLHYGQVAMPDIISLSGLISSIYFAARVITVKSESHSLEKNKRGFLASAILFSFLGVLGKPNSLPYGLPLSLLITKYVQQRRLKLAVFCLYWLIIIIPLTIWNLLILFDPPHSWNIFGAYNEQQSVIKMLCSPMYYSKIIAYISLFGIGIPGVIFLFPGIIKIFKSKIYNPWVPSALFSISCIYLGMSTYMTREPQYTLNILFWLAFIAAIGFNEAHVKGYKIFNGKFFVSIGFIHLIMITWAVSYFKSDKIPNHNSLIAISTMIHPKAKVIQISPSYGATITCYLNHSTATLDPKLKEQMKLLKEFIDMDYEYLLFFDYSLASDSFKDIARLKRKVILARDLAPDVYNFANEYFNKIFEKDGIVLFKMTGGLF